MSKIIWFTGLSGSGKTTLSNILYKNLIKNKKRVLQVDGDTFRKDKKYKENFTKQIITKNNIDIIKKISKIKDKYEFILVAVISPILKTRLMAKKKFKENYFEIFVNCNLKTLKFRDTKGLYKKADLKQITNLIGYKSKIKYEKSSYNVLSLNTNKWSTRLCLKKILNEIK